MQRKNLFDGDSYKAQFALITYRWLMSHRWVSYADIMADYIGVTTKELPANLSNCDGWRVEEGGWHTKESYSR